MDRLFFTQVTERIDPPEFEMLLELISSERRGRIAHLRRDIDKKLSLYSELAVRAVACETMDIKNSDIVFGRSACGKPFLEGHADFQFNICHGKDALLVAVSDRPIGADMEYLRKAVPEIANRFFAPKELLYINRLPFERDKRFYEVWTRKEAYAKYIGEGLPLLFEPIDVKSDPVAAGMFTAERHGYIISSYSGEEKQESEIVELSEESVRKKAVSLL